MKLVDLGRDIALQVVDMNLGTRSSTGTGNLSCAGEAQQ